MTIPSLARSEALDGSRPSSVSPRASAGVASQADAGAAPLSPASAAVTRCAVCHESIAPTSVGTYGHVRNPGSAHHYARPAHTKEETAMPTSPVTTTVSYKARSVTLPDDDLSGAGPLVAEAVRDAFAQANGDFVPSEEVADVAARLIGSGPTFAHLHRHRIAYLVDRRPANASTKSGVHGLAEVKLTPRLWRDLAHVDAAIVVRRSAWDSLTDHQREALVHHELMHLDENDKGALVIRDHDLEEFGATVRAYGQWMPDVEFFAEQLGLFEPAAA